MKSLSRLLLCGTSLGLAAFAVPPAWAQTNTQVAAAQPSEIETVTVTARRKSENLQDVPISVTAISNETLTEKNIINVNDLALAAPGLSNLETSGLHSGTTFSIRGQGETFGQSFPGVVTYFADVPAIGNEFSEFYDMDSVQVLKGPQGTLFGRNTTGGAVLFTPKAPTDHLDGYADARLGDYGRHEFEGAVGGPILDDKIMFRVAGEFLQRDGYTTNVAGGQSTTVSYPNPVIGLFLNPACSAFPVNTVACPQTTQTFGPARSRLDNENRWSVRGSLTIKPIAGLENDTILIYTNQAENGAGESLARVNPASPFAGFLDPILAHQQAVGPRVVDLPLPTADNLKSWAAINTTTWNAFSFLTLKNIVSFRQFETENAYDFSGTPLPLFWVINSYQPTKGMTEEPQVQLNYGRFSGVVGFFYSYDKVSVAPGINPVLEAASFQTPFGLFPGNPPIYVQGGSRDTSKAFYAQGNYEIIDGLTLTAGIRYTQDSRETFSTPFTFGGLPAVEQDPLQGGHCGPEFSGPNGTDLNPVFGNPFTGQNSCLSGFFHAPTWTTAADYKVNDDLNVYGTIRRGYKSGGFNATAPNPAEERFQPEFVTDYEVGEKSTFDVGGLATRLNVDLFYDQYSNIQRYLNTNNVPPATVTLNAAKGYIYGSDLDLTLVPTDYFDLSVLYTYMKAAYTSWPQPAGFAVVGNLTGQKFPNTPTNQFTITPHAHWPVPDNWGGEFNALLNIYYQSAEAVDPFNTSNGNAIIAESVPGANIKGYSRVDLRLEWSNIHDTNASLAFFMTNLTNTTYVVGTDNQLPSAIGTDSFTYGAPRMWGFELNYKFGG